MTERRPSATPTAPPARYDDLRALFVNCTLKPSPQVSHTQALARIAIGIGKPTASRSTSSARSTTTSHPGCSPT